MTNMQEPDWLHIDLVSGENAVGDRIKRFIVWVEGQNVCARCGALRSEPAQRPAELNEYGEVVPIPELHDCGEPWPAAWEAFIEDPEDETVGNAGLYEAIRVLYAKREEMVPGSVMMTPYEAP